MILVLYKVARNSHATLDFLRLTNRCCATIGNSQTDDEARRSMHVYVADCCVTVWSLNPISGKLDDSCKRVPIFLSPPLTSVCQLLSTDLHPTAMPGDLKTGTTMRYIHEAQNVFRNPGTRIQVYEKRQKIMFSKNLRDDSTEQVRCRKANARTDADHFGKVILASASFGAMRGTPHPKGAQHMRWWFCYGFVSDRNDVLRCLCVCLHHNKPHGWEGASLGVFRSF